MSIIAHILLAIVAALSWTAAHAIAPPVPSHYFHDLYVAKNFDLIAAHSNAIYKSVDDGAHWKMVLALPHDPGRRMTLTDMGKSGLLATDYHKQTYHSIDQGEHWNVVGKGYPVTARSKDGTLWSCSGSFYLSKDLGATLSATKTLPAGLYPGPNRCVNVLVLEKMVYVLDNTGVLHRSGDHGASWRKTAPVPITRQGRLIGVTADIEGNLYANTHERASASAYQIYLSRNQGGSWQRLHFGVPPRRQLSAEILAIGPSMLYMRCTFKGNVHESKLCSSAGQRTSLKEGPPDPTTNVGARLIPGPKGRLYSVDLYQIHRTDEQEKNWRPLGAKGLPDPFTGLPR